MNTAFSLNIGHCHIQERTICIATKDALIYKGGEHKGLYNKLLFHELGHILWPLDSHEDEWKLKVDKLHKCYLDVTR